MNYFSVLKHAEGVDVAYTLILLSLEKKDPDRVRRKENGVLVYTSE